MSKLEQLRINLILAERDFYKRWCETYDENKNVSYATNWTIANTSEGQEYLKAKYEYEEYFKLLKSK